MFAHWDVHSFKAISRVHKGQSHKEKTFTERQLGALLISRVRGQSRGKTTGTQVTSAEQPFETTPVLEHSHTQSTKWFINQSTTLHLVHCDSLVVVHPRVQLPSAELSPPSSRDGPTSDTTEWSACNAAPGVIFWDQNVKNSGAQFNQLSTTGILGRHKAKKQNIAELAINLTQGLCSEPVNKWSFILHLGLFVPPF